MNIELEQSDYCGILNNDNITPEVIDELLDNNPGPYIIEAVSDSKNATPKQLERIYKQSKNYTVLLKLASNKNTPPKILQQLVKNTGCELFVYQNPNIDYQLIEEFLSQKKPRTKTALKDYYNKCRWISANTALNKKDQLKLAKKMKSNPNNFFFFYANSSLYYETFEYIWSLGITHYAYRFLDSDHFDPKCIEMLLTTEDESERSIVIQSIHCPDDIIATALNDSSEVIRAAAISNPKLKFDFDSIDYCDYAAVLGVAFRKDVPEDVQLKIANNKYHTTNDSLHDIKSILASSTDSILVFENLLDQGVFGVGNCSLTIDIIEKILDVGETRVRSSVLRHSNIPIEILISLLGLHNKSVLSKPFFNLPEWYKNLITDVEKVIKEDDYLSLSSIPKIFIPSFKSSINSKDEIIGVIGGYYFQSTQGDKKIAEGYAAPILQINLNKLSEKFGVDFGDVILQVWGDSDDWGQGNSALLEVVNREDIIDRNDDSCVNVKLPTHLIDAEQYDQATDCFDWSDSYYSNYLNLNGPFFITDLECAGVNTQLFTLKQSSLCEEKLNKNHKDTAEIKDFAKENSYFEESLSRGYIEAINYIQEFKLSTSLGNFDKESYVELLTEYDDDFDDDEYFETEAIGLNSWKPLITMHGPLSDPIEDYYSVYYRINDKSEVEYKAMARRWSY